MKFSCNQDTFAKHLSILSRVVQSKPGLPILNNILFEVSKNKVSMTTTDLEISLNCWIGAEVMDEGKTTIPAKQLSEFINSIPNEKIDINFEDNVVYLETKNNKAQFNTIISDDYPKIPTTKKTDKPILKIPKEDILKAITRVGFSSAKDDIKPVLTGTLVEISKETINFVATDGLRLSKQVLELKTDTQEEKKLLIPTKAFEELARIINDFDGEENSESVEIYYIEKKNQVVFKYSDIELISRLIDGEFPEYKQIIPTGFQTKYSFAQGEFLNSLKIVNIIAKNIAGNKMIMDIDIEKNIVNLSAAQSDVGSNNSEFLIKGEGESLNMAFSGKFLLEILNNIHEKEMSFECMSSSSPGIFRIKDDTTFIHLIMPMRV